MHTNSLNKSKIISVIVSHNSSNETSYYGKVWECGIFLFDIQKKIYAKNTQVIEKISAKLKEHLTFWQYD